jgi:hypothetical protein
VCVHCASMTSYIRKLIVASQSNRGPPTCATAEHDCQTRCREHSLKDTNVWLGPFKGFRRA